MNDNAKKWVEALRSGKYRQGKCSLYDPSSDTYCCLGVACEVFMQHRPGRIDKMTDEVGGVLYDGNQTVLPEAVVEWLGLFNSVGQFDGCNSLIRWNDEMGKSFHAIADLIESEPDGLFKELK